MENAAIAKILEHALLCVGDLIGLHVLAPLLMCLLLLVLLYPLMARGGQVLKVFLLDVYRALLRALVGQLVVLGVMLGCFLPGTRRRSCLVLNCLEQGLHI